MWCAALRVRDAMLPMADRASEEAAETQMTAAAVANANAARETLLTRPVTAALDACDASVLANLDDCYAVRFAARWMPIYAFALRYSVETVGDFECNAVTGEQMRYRRRVCDTRDADHARLMVLLANAFSSGAADAVSMSTPPGRDTPAPAPLGWPQRMATLTGTRSDSGAPFEGVELLAPEAHSVAQNDAYLEALCEWLPVALSTLYRRWTLITGDARMRPDAFDDRDSNTLRVIDFCNQTVKCGGLIAVRHVFSRDVGNIIRLVDRVAWGSTGDGLASIGATVATLHPHHQSPSTAQTIALIAVQRRFVPTFLRIYEMKRAI
jgi:hypothetical protein